MVVLDETHYAEGNVLSRLVDLGVAEVATPGATDRANCLFAEPCQRLPCFPWLKSLPLPLELQLIPLTLSLGICYNITDESPPRHTGLVAKRRWSREIFAGARRRLVPSWR